MLRGASLFVARAWTQLASMLLFIAAARILSHDEVGVFALASALTMVLTQWVGVGTYEYVIRERVDRRAEHTAFWINAALAAFLAVVGAALAFGAAAWFHTTEITAVILALAPLTLPAGCRSAVEAILVRDDKLMRLSISTAVVEAVSLAAGLAALASGLGLWALVIHKWTQTLTAAISFAVGARWRPALRFDKDVAAAMARFGGGIFGDRVLSYFQTYGVDLFLGALLSPAAVGVFRVGARMVTACATIVTEPLRQLNWKMLSDAAHEGRSVPRTGERLIGLMIGIMAGPMIGLVVTADPLVRVVLGERWLSCVPIIQFLALASFLSTPQFLTEAALGVQSKTRWLPVVRAGAVATLFTLLFAVGHRGPSEAAVSQLFAALVLSAAAVVIQLRLVGIRPQGYLADLVAFSTAAGVMAGAVVGVGWLAGRYQWSDLANLGASVTVGGVCYAAVVMALRYREVSEFAKTAAARMRRGGAVGASEPQSSDAL